MNFYYKMVPGDTYCVTGYKGDENHIEFPTNITITIINDSVFKGHTEINSITFPETVTQIGGFVFDGCTGLKEIKLPSSYRTCGNMHLLERALKKLRFPVLLLQ